jgi:hypothetical protein
MKKLFSIFLVVILLFSLTTAATAGIVPDAQAFTTTDAMTILRYVAGLITLTEGQRGRLDINGDGKITTEDAIMILRVIAGLPARG